MKRVHSPHHGALVAVGGRKAPKRDTKHHTRLHLKNYLTMHRLPDAPDCDYSKEAPAALADVLANDALGDCTCAGVGHIIDAITAAAGIPYVVSRDQVIALYSATCGYTPGNPESDQGGDEYTVLDYMCTKGLDGAGLHKFDASVIVDPFDRLEVRAAVWLFGNLYFGEALPEGYVAPFPSSNGFTWGEDAGPANPDNGHCFVGLGSTPDGIIINSWGMKGLHTYRAIEKYAARAAGGELHTILSPDIVNAASKRAPSGFDWDQLKADLEAVGAYTSEDS